MIDQSDPMALHSETSFRSVLMALAQISNYLGVFIVLWCGSILSWRQVSFICVLTPICCLIAVFFVSFIHLFNILLGCKSESEANFESKSSSGPWIATLVAIQRPPQGYSKGLAMATWLGLTANHSQRIHRATKLQQYIKRLRCVYERGDSMFSSEANNMR